MDPSSTPETFSTMGDYFKLAAQTGLPGVLMLYAIKWLNANNKNMCDQLARERDERITLLESHIKDCDSDRKSLRSELIGLLTKQVDSINHHS